MIWISKGGSNKEQVKLEKINLSLVYFCHVVFSLFAIYFCFQPPNVSSIIDRATDFQRLDSNIKWKSSNNIYLNMGPLNIIKLLFLIYILGITWFSFDVTTRSRFPYYILIWPILLFLDTLSTFLVTVFFLYFFARGLFVFSKHTCICQGAVGEGLMQALHL